MVCSVDLTIRLLWAETVGIHSLASGDTGSGNAEGCPGNESWAAKFVLAIEHVVVGRENSPILELNCQRIPDIRILMLVPTDRRGSVGSGVVAEDKIRAPSLAVVLANDGADAHAWGDAACKQDENPAIF